jgi:hypothetical protein
VKCLILLFGGDLWDLITQTQESLIHNLGQWDS